MDNKEESLLTKEETTSDDKSDSLYTINNVATLLDVHQQTLRNWEKKKLIKPLRVGKNRIYTMRHIEICRKIKEYSGKGICLRGIKELLDKI